MSRLIIKYNFVLMINSFIKRTETESSLFKPNLSLLASGSICLTALPKFQVKKKKKSPPHMQQRAAYRYEIIKNLRYNLLPSQTPTEITYSYFDISILLLLLSLKNWPSFSQPHQLLFVYRFMRSPI
jgi:ribosomal protein S30